MTSNFFTSFLGPTIDELVLDTLDALLSNNADTEPEEEKEEGEEDEEERLTLSLFADQCT